MNIPTQVVTWTQGEWNGLTSGWLCVPTSSVSSAGLSPSSPACGAVWLALTSLAGGSLWFNLGFSCDKWYETSFFVLHHCVSRVTCLSTFHTHLQRFFKFKHLKFFIF